MEEARYPSLRQFDTRDVAAAALTHSHRQVTAAVLHCLESAAAADATAFVVVADDLIPDLCSSRSRRADGPEAGKCSSTGERQTLGPVCS